MNIYVVGSDYGVTEWLKARGHNVTNIANPLETAEKLDDPELVVFTGGEDVWPALYGEENTDSACNPRRDLTEMIWFHRFLRVKKLGICRGGQFLNVMSGGSMEQDHKHHALAGCHNVYWVASDKVLRATSTHHQIMQVGENANLLAYALDMPDGQNTTEVCLYRHTRSLCFQPHPEYNVNDKTNQTIKLLELSLNWAWRIEI